MKQLILSLALLVLGTAAQAECYADYKAKRDDPLRLHYGVAQIEGPCTIEAAEDELAVRLAEADWQLLNVVGVFGDEGLEERRGDAGDYYLSF